MQVILLPYLHVLQLIEKLRLLLQYNRRENLLTRIKSVCILQIFMVSDCTTVFMCLQVIQQNDVCRVIVRDKHADTVTYFIADIVVVVM